MTAQSKIQKICTEIKEYFEQKHIKELGGKKLLIISTQYRGLWLEHCYDAVFMQKWTRQSCILQKTQ